MNIKSQFTTKQIQTSINHVKEAKKQQADKQSEIEKKLIDKLKKHKTEKHRSFKPSYHDNNQSKHAPKKFHKTEPKAGPKVKFQGKKLKIIAIGGFEEVGKNCTAIEYENDIILIDLGFQFPQSDMLGVDYVLPDLSYIKKNRTKLRGIFITHGHLDHTGAIPYVINQIGYPPIFSSRLTLSLIKQRLSEFPDINAILKQIDPEKDKIRLGSFNIEFFRVNHNIPDSIGIVVHTPEGTIVHTGDYKFDFTPATDKPADMQRIAEIGRNKVLVLMSDSTNAGHKGHTISEKEIGENIDIAFSKCDGRIIVATFSSLLSRIQQVINSAARYHRKVTFLGRSMLQIIEIATELKYFKLPPGILIDPRDMRKYSDEKIVIIATGSQGQESSAVGRMSTGDHRQVHLKKSDTVILSSSPIPGNESPITNMVDNIIRQGARVIDDKSMDIHASGHGSNDDLKTMISLICPEHLLPIHGSLSMRYNLSQLGQDMGIPEEKVILLDNGGIAEFGQKRLLSTDQKVTSGLVFVDGLGVGDVGNVVIRDRQQLSVDGMIVITVIVRKDKIKASEEEIFIVSRGFVYMKEADQIMKQIKNHIIRIIDHHDQKAQVDLSAIKNQIRDDIGEFVFAQTQRRPMIIISTIEV
jgi:ribonuclease J